MLRNRFRRIIYFFARAIISVLFWDVLLPRIGFRRLSARSRSERLRRIAHRYRKLAIKMGGVLIKVGQFLSSRMDMMPPEITNELSNLQDKVPAEDFDDIREIAETELGQPLSEAYASFTEEPLAAASLGQVHRAKLNKPVIKEETDQSPITEVVVKVQRPKIEKIIATDMAALNIVAKWLQRYRPIRRRADLPSVMKEFSDVLYEEIDYLAEGKNAETFAVNFADYPGVNVPQVIWSRTTKRVLTLEDVYAIKITDYEAITASGVDRVEVAERLFKTYLEQIFNHESFHADPHPGNLFVSPVAPSTTQSQGTSSKVEWELTFVDFGMVGHVSPNIYEGLREAIIAVGTQDAKRVVGAYQKLGMLLPGADLEMIERAEEMAFERFWGKSMRELREIEFKELREFATEFRELMYDMPFQIPQDLLLLGRTVAILSGMCTGLDPQFNVWENLSPFAKQLLAEETSTGWEFWLAEIGAALKAIGLLPRRLDTVLRKIEQGEVEVVVPRLEAQLQLIEHAFRRMIGTLIFAALLMGGVQFYSAGNTNLGNVLLGGAFLALSGVVLSGMKRR